MKNLMIKILVVDKYDKARYYLAIVSVVNANKEYVLDLLKSKYIIESIDKIGFNKRSGNIITFTSPFETNLYEDYPANTVLDSNW